MFVLLNQRYKPFFEIRSAINADWEKLLFDIRNSFQYIILKGIFVLQKIILNTDLINDLNDCPDLWGVINQNDNLPA